MLRIISILILTTGLFSSFSSYANEETVSSYFQQFDDKSKLTINYQDLDLVLKKVCCIWGTLLGT